MDFPLYSRGAKGDPIDPETVSIVLVVLWTGGLQLRWTCLGYSFDPKSRASGRERRSVCDELRL